MCWCVCLCIFKLEILALRALYIYLFVMWHRIKWIFTIGKIKNNIRDLIKEKQRKTKKNDKLLRKLGMKWMCAHKNSIVQHKSFREKKKLGRSRWEKCTIKWIKENCFVSVSE